MVHGVKNNGMSCYKWHAPAGAGCGLLRSHFSFCWATQEEMLSRDRLGCVWTAKIVLLFSLSSLSFIAVNHAQLDNHGKQCEALSSGVNFHCYIILKKVLSFYHVVRPR